MLVAVVAVFSAATGAWITIQVGVKGQYRYKEALESRQDLAWKYLVQGITASLDQTAMASVEQVAVQVAREPGGERCPSITGIAPDVSGVHTFVMHVGSGLRCALHADAPTPDIIAIAVIERVVLSARPLRALARGSDGLLYVFAAQPLPTVSGRSPWALFAAVSAAGALASLESVTGAHAFLADEFGRRYMGEPAKALDQLALQFGAGSAMALTREHNGAVWLVGATPLTDQDNRPLGFLVTVSDVTAAARGDRLATRQTLLFALVILLLVGLAYTALPRLLSPATAVLEALNALARGNTRVSIDPADLNDPGMQRAARNVVALQDEMRNLLVLREERERGRQQQSRIMRGEMARLAAILSPEARAELDRPADGAGQDLDDNEFAQLARLMRRLSGLILDQHDRLRALLQEVQANADGRVRLAALARELSVAARMQESILPIAPPSDRRASATAVMVPAKEIGGDFYDYFMIDANHLAMVVADVSGKGMPAAFFMAIARTVLRSKARHIADPASCISEVNETLAAENEQTMFVTTFYAVLDLRNGRLDYVNAGHNPPLLRTQDGRWRYLPKSTNVALAIAEGYAYTSQTLQLAAGEALLAYTDGVTEATSVGGELFGEERLVAAVSAGDPLAVAALPAAVVSAVCAFEAGAPQADDITLMALCWLGEHASAP